MGFGKKEVISDREEPFLWDGWEEILTGVGGEGMGHEESGIAS